MIRLGAFGVMTFFTGYWFAKGPYFETWTGLPAWPFFIGATVCACYWFFALAASPPSQHTERGEDT